MKVVGNMKLKGTIKLIQDKVTFDSGFTKQILVLTVKDGQYEEHLPIEFLKDATELLNDFAPGQDCEIDINLKGREWEGKYFGSIQGWKIEATF